MKLIAIAILTILAIGCKKKEGVAISDQGVEINVPGVSMRVSDDGVNINTSEVKMNVDENGVDIETPEASIKVEEGNNRSSALSRGTLGTTGGTTGG